jgi:hypothetical protein
MSDAVVCFQNNPTYAGNCGGQQWKTDLEIKTEAHFHQFGQQVANSSEPTDVPSVLSPASI